MPKLVSWYQIPTLRIQQVLLLSFLILTAGCGSGMVQVSGTVKVNGEPAEGVILIFQPIGEQSDGFPATAASGPGGDFSLTTNMEPGVPKGSYKITANWPDPDYKPNTKGLGFSDPEPAPDLLKGRYMGQSSVSTQEISSSMSDLVIELTL